MTGNFTFVGRQYPIRINNNEFFIDLLFYHRDLACLVAIELKAGVFKAEYAGKMAMYLAALDKFDKRKNENTSIGIIICKEKDRDVVDLSLQYITKPIGVSTYKTYTEKDLPKEISIYMPGLEEFGKRLIN